MTNLICVYSVPGDVGHSSILMPLGSAMLASLIFESVTTWKGFRMLGSSNTESCACNCVSLFLDNSWGGGGGGGLASGLGTGRFLEGSFLYKLYASEGERRLIDTRRSFVSGRFRSFTV